MTVTIKVMRNIVVSLEMYTFILLELIKEKLTKIKK